MSRLTHDALAKAFGFALVLDEDPKWLSKALNNDSGWSPSYSLVIVLCYIAVRSKDSSIEAYEAINVLTRYPDRIRQILTLLDDTDIFSANAIGAAIHPVTQNLADSSALLMSWASRQSVKKMLRARGLSES